MPVSWRVQTICTMQLPPMQARAATSPDSVPYQDTPQANCDTTGILNMRHMHQLGAAARSIASQHVTDNLPQHTALNLHFVIWRLERTSRSHLL